MANSVKFTAGTSNVPPTAGRLVADTSGGTVNLILPSIEELQNFQLRGSGFSVAGTFNFSFEKIGNGQLIFNVAKQDLETINGSANLVVNDIGSGIIFITSDFGWGITNFSHSNSSFITSKVDASVAQFNASVSDAPIISIPEKAGSLILPIILTITIIADDGSGAPTILSYGYKGNTPIGDIDLTGLVAGSKVIFPIVAPKNYAANRNPVGQAFGFYKKSGSVAINFAASYIET